MKPERTFAAMSLWQEPAVESRQNPFACKELRRGTIADKEGELKIAGVNDSKWSMEESIKTSKCDVAEEKGDVGNLVAFGLLGKIKRSKGTELLIVNLRVKKLVNLVLSFKLGKN